MSDLASEEGHRLRVVDPVSEPKWDNFVSQHPDSKVYHCSAWSQVISRTFGYSSCGVLAERERDGHVVGIMPLSYIDHRLIGKRLVGLPFTTYCDPLMTRNILERSIAFIKNRFSDANYIQFRLLKYDPFGLVSTIPEEEYITHILDLRPGRDAILNRFHSTSIRQRIRRAERIGLTFRFGDSEDDLKIFYNLLVGVRKRHGLPPHPYEFFRNMWCCLVPAGLMKLIFVELQNKPIGAAVLLMFGDTIHLEYSASDPKTMKLCTNQKLIWECIKHAYNIKASFFDFGRSAIANKSLIEFKERWGATRWPLAYVTLPPQANQGPEEGLPQRFVTALNKRMPQWLLRLEGELLYRKLGRS